jgi:hypothetical protein
MKIMTLLLSVVLLTSCSTSTKNSDDKTQKALTLVKKVCDGDNELSWQERANLAAQANALDNRWKRLSNSTNYQAAWEGIAKLRKEVGNLADYNEEAVQFFYQSQLNYTKLTAECSILELSEGNSK